MTNMLKDISNKLEPTHVEVLRGIVQLTSELAFPFFILGATARDIMYTAIFGIQTIRATRDIDLAIRVDRWEDYQELRKRMLADGQYNPDKSQKQRLIHRNGTRIDLFPFGTLEDPAGTISWPPEKDVVMRTAGFEEALRSSLDVLISNDPQVKVKVCTSAALAVMKIISWHDNHPSRAKDAEDVMFFMKNYIGLGNEIRLWGDDSDILKEDTYDYDQASARILGRDMRKIMTEDTFNLVRTILDHETNLDSQLKMISDMTKAKLGDAEEVLTLLIAMKKGILDLV